MKKCKKCALDLEFLETCKAYEITPKFVRFKLHKKSLHSTDFYQSWQFKLLDCEISSKTSTLKKRSEQCNESWENLSANISSLDGTLLHYFVHEEVKRMSADVRETHRKKLENLGISGSIAPCDPDKVIFNFSSAVVSLRLKKLLAFGLDFGMPVFKLDYIKYFLCFEKIANYLQNIDCIGDRTEFKEILRMTANKFFNAFKPSKKISVMTREDVKLLKEFSSNKNIVVSKPDKGRGIVIVDRAHYVDGVSKIIENSNKFELVTEEIKRVSRQAEDRINTFLLDIKKLKYISTALYNKLHVTGSGPGILYGLPKVHKPRFLADKLYRPIFAAYNCANFNISNFLVDILAHISENEYYLKNIQVISTTN